MPIYEYRCDNCGHDLETIQKVSEDPLKRCPACEQDTLRKKISAAAFRLKGGGWYETDFKSDKKRNVAGDEKGSGGGKDGGEGGKESTSGDKAGSDRSASKSSESTGQKAGDSSKSSGEGKGTSNTSKPNKSD